jgi:hypothetical protein
VELGGVVEQAPLARVRDRQGRAGVFALSKLAAGGMVSVWGHGDLVAADVSQRRPSGCLVVGTRQNWPE